jgi:hypothetical protein
MNSNENITRYSRFRQGSVLILVLIVLSSMTVISAGLAYRTMMDVRLAHAHARRTQAYYLALGGIQRAKVRLSAEELAPLTIARINGFTRNASEEGLFEQVRDSVLGEDCSLSYGLRDELGYLNLNRSDPSSWINIGYLSEEQCATILDWIDEDNDAGPGGAETDFYERLQIPYVSKDAPFVTTREMLYLKGVTYDSYLGEDLNRNNLLDENERDGSSRPPFDNEDNELDVGMVDIFTVYGEGKVNINTTHKRILSGLPGLDEEVAESISAHLAGPDGQFNTDDDTCFASVDDIANVEALTELQVELLGQYCCFESAYFRVFSSAGLKNPFECCLMAILDCTESRPRIVSLERLL